MSPLFESIALWLADVHLLGGALLALVLPALLLLRQPAQRMAVAKSALAALAALVILCALPGWSLVHLLSAEAPPAPVTVAASEPPALPFTPPVVQYDPTLDALFAPVQQPIAVASPAPAPAPEAPALPAISWPAALVLLQAIGSAAVVAWLAVGAIMVRRVRRTSQPASPELQRLLAELSRATSPPSLLSSVGVSTPVALGLRSPAILLPADLATNPHRRAELPAILAHEYAHVAAGDLRTLALARLLLAIFWPQPLFWLLRRRIRFDQESLADAAAAEVAGRVNYAEQLVGWARTAPPRVPRLAGAIGLWEGPSQLKRRITLLLDEKLTILRHASRRWRIGTACAALVAAALLSLVTVQRQEVVAAASTTTNPSSDAAEQPLSDSPDPETSAAETEPVSELATEPATITGRIVLEDGSPATTAGWLESENEFATGKGSRSGTEGSFTDKFTLKAQPGTLVLKYFAKGFAPAWAGPFQLKSGDQQDVVITLKPGVTSTLEVVDDAGTPIRGAKAYATPFIEGSGNGPMDEKDVEGGRLTLEHLADVTYSVNVRAPGYQPIRGAKVDFRADDVIRVTMKKSSVIAGTIRDAQGAPAAGALLLRQALLSDEGSEGTRQTTAADASAIADDQGRYRLDQLEDGSQYAFIIETADKSRLLVTDVFSTDGERDFTVPARRDLRGRILGDLSGLPIRNGKPFVTVRQRFDVQRPDSRSGSYSGLFGSDPVVTPTAEGGAFTYEGLLEGEVEITVGDEAHKFPPVGAPGISEFIIDLKTGNPPTVATDALAPSPVLLEQSTGPQVTVVCRDTHGSPLPDVWVEAYQFLASDPAGSCAQRAVSKTGSNGDKSFPVEMVVHKIVRGETDKSLFAPDESTVVIIAHDKGRATATAVFDAAALLAEGGKAELVMEPAAALRGGVVDPEGRPVAGAIIRLDEFPLDAVVAQSEVYSAHSDASGAFSIDDLPAYHGKLSSEEVSIAHSATGRTPHPRNFEPVLPFRVTHPDFAAPRLFVKQVPDSLRIQLERPATLAGRVVYENEGAENADVPAAEISVHLATYRSDSPAELTPETRTYEATTKTDADGNYRFTNIPAGKYAITVRYAKKVADPINVSSGESQSVPTIEVPLVNGLARLQLRDPSGAPLVAPDWTQALILAYDGERPSLIAAEQVPVAKSGLCSLRLPAGKYRLRVQALSTSDHKFGFDVRADEIPIELSDGETTDADVKFTKVEVRKLNDSSSDGDKLVVNGDGGAGSSSTSEVSLPFLNVMSGSPPAQLMVSTRDETSWARPEANVVKGRAVAPSSEPLAGIEVTLYRHANGLGGGGAPEAISVQTTGVDGTFRFENVVDVAKEFPGGLPDERFLEAPVSVLTVVGRAPGRASATGGDIAVGVAKRGAVQQLILGVAATLTGRITDRAGRPVADAAVRLSHSFGSPLGDLVNTARTDADGRYSITDLLPYDAEEAEKRRKIEQLAQRQQSESGDTFFLAVDESMRVQVRHSDFATRGAKILTVPGTIDLELAPASVIEGVVMTGDRTGIPLPAANAVVTLMRELPENRRDPEIDLATFQSQRVQADSAGRYQFGGLAAGSYTINAQVKGFVSNGLTGVKADEGATATAPELVMTRGGKVRIKLVEADTNQPLSVPNGTRGYVNTNPAPVLPPSGVVVFEDSVGELQLPPGRYGFYVTIPGATPGSPYGNSVAVVREHDVVEGETLEITALIKKQTPPTTATGTFQLTPLFNATPAPSDDSAPVTPTLDFVPEPSLNLVPPTAPADDQGAGAGRLPGGPDRASGEVIYHRVGDATPTTIASNNALSPVRAPAPTSVLDALSPASDAFENSNPDDGVLSFVAVPAPGTGSGDPASDIEAESAETTHAAQGLATIVAVDAVGAQTVLPPGQGTPRGKNIFTVRCLDAAGKPLEGVAAQLYDVQFRAGTQELLAEAKSNAEGIVEFTDVASAERLADYAKPADDSAALDKRFINFDLIVLRHPGLATMMFGTMDVEVALRGYRADVTLPAAAKLSGRVTSPDGRPVAGARVAAGSYGSNLGIDGVNVVRTDADGRYEFTDRAPFDAAKGREQRDTFLSYSMVSSATTGPQQAIGEDLSASSLLVSHPDFAVTQVEGGDIPGVTDVTMKPAAAIAGRVVTTTGAAPAAGLLIRAASLYNVKIGPDGKTPVTVEDTFTSRPTTDTASTRTDAAGRYMLSNLPAGVYDVWAVPADDADPSVRYSDGAPRIVALAGTEPAAAPDLIVGPGALVRGQLIDAKTGKPLLLAEEAKATIGCEPEGGTRMQDRASPTVAVSRDGKFEFRTRPGKFRMITFVFAKATPRGEGRPIYVSPDRQRAPRKVYEATQGGGVDVAVPVVAYAEMEKQRAALSKAYSLGEEKKFAEAIAVFQELLREEPTSYDALFGVANGYEALKDFPAAIVAYETALVAHPDDPNLLWRMATLMASSPDDKVRDGKRAVELATTLVAKMRNDNDNPETLAQMLAVLAAAHAEAGDFPSAIKAQTEALDLASPVSKDSMKGRLELYESGKPYRR